MCLADNYSKQLISLYEEIIEQHNNVVKELKDIELIHNDIEHIIENENFNASQGFMYAKKLQEIRKKRRLLKAELVTLEQLRHNYVNKNYNDIKSLRGNIIKEDEKYQQLIEEKKYRNRMIAKEDILYAQYVG